MDSLYLDFLKGMLKPATAVVLSFAKNLGLEKEMVHSIARAFLQFSVTGFFMVVVAGYTAGQRANNVP
ncbi:hypothetical protein Sjap_001670 [Stephania japonica]|uniref:Uncharacterized protein n=1 Tax=Stephania japonica TaxID=461633 RepID=A0AAP0KLA1_9MAGN